MEFRTHVDIPHFPFSIEPLERMLFVGSCFADSIGRRFVEEQFRATVNPYGVMYNPVSVLHTVRRWVDELHGNASTERDVLPARTDTPSMRDTLPARIVVITLGTNHVYRLNETGEIVDNCRKRPQRLFTEEELTVEQCCEALREAVGILHDCNPEVRVVLTVSPIRYAKYGFHGSQLSKATLLLAADNVVRQCPYCHYFPAYEIVNDELRDYRFYKEDMLHPSEQTVKYIWEIFRDHYFSPAANVFLERWRPIKEALAHKPFNPDGEEYKAFMQRTREKLRQLQNDYPQLRAE